MVLFDFPRADDEEAIFKIVEQMPDQSGIVPQQGVTKAYWKMKPYLNTDQFAGGGSMGGK